MCVCVCVYNPACSSWCVPLLWSFSLDYVAIWLAVVQSQFLSLYVWVRVCVLNMFVISWGLVKCSMYNETLSLLQYVHLFVSTIHLLFQWPDWLFSGVQGPGSLSPHHNRPASVFIVGWQQILSITLFFTLYISVPQHSCCKYSSPLSAHHSSLPINQIKWYKHST